jgi:hypothetical protein
MNASVDGEESWYDVAMVCANGHVVNDEVGRLPAKNSSFCPQCGEGTMTTCPECDALIRGLYHEGRIIVPHLASPPNYCHECGEPYPWTAERLKAADELIDEIRRLSEEESDLLKASVREIMTDNPRTQVAALHLGKGLRRAGKTIAPLLYDMAQRLAIEAAKGYILPPRG